AARRLAVTQSAMSQTLSRLREAFDDPLLVREGREMAPTPRAQALALPLRAALRELQAVVAEDPVFDPARDARSFTLAVHDYNAALVLPRLLPGLRQEAPSVSLRLVPFEPGHVVEQLRSGEVDLALSVVRELPADLVDEPVAEEEMVGIARRDHPLLEGPITPARFAAYPQGLLSITGRGGGRIDALLEAQGLSRDIRVRVPYFLVAPQVVATSDLLLAVPDRLAEHFAAAWPVRAFPLPLPPLRFTVSMVSSRRLQADPAQRWLRARVAEAARRGKG
ncbi:MAG: LysR family transcriptional regulator, partial [Alphaproteobacteria bacterium]|nr:LysR family transcriptional regulator [Alphaproteobacteria bacterium]